VKQEQMLVLRAAGPLVSHKETEEQASKRFGRRTGLIISLKNQQQKQH
jgi:hypothetical protein